MLIRSFLPFLFLETPADAVGGGAISSEAAPAAPDSATGAPPSPEPAPASEPAPSIEAMHEAAANRLLGETPPEELLGDDAPYRDAKALRDEIAKTREQYGPAAQALGALPEATREAVVTLAPAFVLTAGDPGLAEDLSYLQANYPLLDAEDRGMVQAVMAEVGNRPTDVADWIRSVVEVMRVPDPDAPDDGADDPDAPDPDDPSQQPMTIAEYEARRQAEAEAAEQERSTRETAERILNEARELGYDPTPSDDDPDGPWKRANWNLLVETAKQLPDGSLQKAHEELERRNQELIDRYVQGKLPDGTRPQPPAGGAPASGERRFGTIEEMHQAAAERVRNL